MGWIIIPQIFIVIALFNIGNSYIEALVGNAEIHTSNLRKYEPMVAFLCNKPSMVRVPSGWVKDARQDCTKNMNEILEFCRKRYPNHNVTNVVRSNFPVTINNWCKDGRGNCHSHGSHTVYPFRCLVGPFQSAALLVPQHCIFDHYHDSKVCSSEMRWNRTSIRRCELKNMMRQSFDILLPCKTVGTFSGVEYVCCPYEKPHVSISVHVDHHAKPKHMKESVVFLRPYMSYIKHSSSNGKTSEHEQYEFARKDWQKSYHDRITKIMRDWSDERDRNNLLNATDPQRAAKESRQIQHKFEKLYHAMEAEGLAEKAQLSDIHQNRVQRMLNEKKRNAMQRYMDELQRDHPEATKLLQSLERYLRVEQKDRRHSVNHFQHLHDVNPDEAKRIRGDTVNHLRWIDTRILQGVKMLHRFPDIESRLKPQIEKFLRRFRGIAASARAIVHPDEQKKVVEEAIAKQLLTTEPVRIVETTREPELVSVEQKITTESIVKAPIVEEVVIKDEEDEEDERKDMEITYTHDEEPKKFISHQTDSRVAHDPVVYKKPTSAARPSSLYGATAGIAIGSVSVFVVVVAVIVKLKKRRSPKAAITHGFVEVDQVTPEERHVANMQINGYENPTYKYFEK